MSPRMPINTLGQATPAAAIPAVGKAIPLSGNGMLSGIQLDADAIPTSTSLQLPRPLITEIVAAGRNWSGPVYTNRADSIEYVDNDHALCGLELSFVAPESNANTEMYIRPGETKRFDGIFRKFWYRAAPVDVLQIPLDLTSGVYRTVPRSMFVNGTTASANPTNNISAVNGGMYVPGNISLRAGMGIAANPVRRRPGAARRGAATVIADLVIHNFTVTSGTAGICHPHNLWPVYHLRRFRRCLLEVQCRSQAQSANDNQSALPSLGLLLNETVNTYPGKSLRTVRFGGNAFAAVVSSVSSMVINMGDPVALGAWFDANAASTPWTILAGAGGWGFSARWILDDGEPSFLRVEQADTELYFNSAGEWTVPTSPVAFSVPTLPGRSRVSVAGIFGATGAVDFTAVPGDGLDACATNVAAVLGTVDGVASKAFQFEHDFAGFDSGAIVLAGQVATAATLKSLRISNRRG